jgi:class 3 adenylate cyclase/tetratricopeptide (TPR) repeat protein
MTCPGCGFENPAGMKFCGECGAVLQSAPRCPGCGFENPSAFKFCGECGAGLSSSVPDSERDPRSYTPKHLADRILTTRSALEGERKQVTVLFADVKGSMELADQIDPEEWHRILSRFFEILAEGVHRFEGTVNQYTGDGVMALFGAPIAHEDHAERACHAALHLRDGLRRYAEEIRRTRGLGFDVRMGLNTGEVVVGKIGDDLRMDYTAQGYTVGLAARIEQLAYPGSAYVAEQTASLVRGFFRLRDLGEFDLKGAREPVHVYELEGKGELRTRLDLSRARGFSRFVGRSTEMALLESGLDEVLEGSGRVIGVVAGPGVGKSRLCVEFLERCRARGIPTYQAHGLPHGKVIPFLPVFEFLRNFFGITDRDRDDSAREKIAGRVLLLDESLREQMPLLFDFLGVTDPEKPAPQMNPETRQRQLYGAIKRLLQVRSEREPIVVLLDDLHWFDRGSDDFLTEVLGATGDIRSLLVVNFRPEYEAEWMSAPQYGQIELGPLGPGAIRELLDDLLGTDPSLQDLSETISARAGGNPFFVEEAIQSLVEGERLEGARGAYRLVGTLETVSIPDRVQAILAARIDRLPEREKHVLQTAAVVGKRFSPTLLERVVGMPNADLEAALLSLEDADFIYEETGEDDVEYAFKHPLTQEVSYGSQLAEPRSRVHGALARTLQELYPDRLDEDAALIAHHFEGAGELFDAVEWHRRAARWAGKTGFAEASRHWRRIRELLLEVETSPERDELRVESCMEILSLSWRVGTSEKELEEVFTEGKRLGEELGNTTALTGIHAHYGVARGSLFGDVKSFVEHTGEAANLAEDSGIPELLRAVLAGRITALSVAGRFKDAITVCNLVLDVDKGEPESAGSGFDVFTYLRLRRGQLWGIIGRLDRAKTELDQGLDLARARSEPELVSWAQGWRAQLAFHRGDPDEALVAAQESLELAEKLDLPAHRVSARRALGAAHFLRGEWAQGAEAFEGSVIGPADRSILAVDEGARLAYLAVALCEMGEVEGAKSKAQEAILLCQKQGTKYEELLGWLALGWVLVRGEKGRAKAEFDRVVGHASELARETSAEIVRPLLCFERAELARLNGDAESRERELREAHRLLVGMGATGHAERIGRLLDA